MLIKLARLLPYFLLLFCGSALAGRPFFTDDAALTTPNTCQIESWVQVNGNQGSDIWAVPACNPSGNFEITLGINRLQMNSDSNTQSYLLQGKTLLKKLKTNDWGLGLAFGVIRSTEGRAGTDFIYLPLSISFDDDNLTLHTNLGWVKDRTQGSNRTSWGLGADYVLAERTSVFAEVFGEDVIKPMFHTGFNFTLIPNRLNLNLTYGYNQALEHNNHLYSVGLNIYSLP